MERELYRVMSGLETVGIELESLMELQRFLIESLFDSAAKVGEDPYRALYFVSTAELFGRMFFVVYKGLNDKVIALNEQVAAGYDTVKQQ